MGRHSWSETVSWTLSFDNLHDERSLNAVHALQATHILSKARRLDRLSTLVKMSARL